jgi:hypothetical protein
MAKEKTEEGNVVDFQKALQERRGLQDTIEGAVTSWVSGRENDERARKLVQEKIAGSIKGGDITFPFEDGTSRIYPSEVVDED